MPKLVTLKGLVLIRSDLLFVVSISGEIFNVSFDVFEIFPYGFLNIGDVNPFATHGKPVGCAAGFWDDDPKDDVK